MFQSPAIKDEILKSYIEQIFTRYDTNSAGTLNPTEMTSFFNDLFRSLNIPLVLSAQQSLEAIKAVQPSYNGTVNREELFSAFKVLLGLYFPPHAVRRCRSSP
jgi:Ca2+-binding EF-hand superfamily protein